MKCNIFLVESPLQLINAYEAIHHYCAKNVVMFVRYSNLDINDKQINKLLSILPLSGVRVFRFNINPEKKNIRDFFNVCNAIFLTLRLTLTVSRLFIGNYDSGFFKIILRLCSPKTKIVLLDDGNKSIRIQKEIDTEGRLEFFTTFDVMPTKKNHVVLNNYPKIKELVKAGKVLDRSVVFIGSGMAEIGIVSEEYYVSLIDRIVEHYNNLDFYVIYIPHRAESSQKLNIIVEKTNVEIRHLDYPVELFGLFNDFSPFLVSSFCSTALITLKNIYGYSVECFSFDYVGHSDEEELDELYKFYQEIGIEVKSL